MATHTVKEPIQTLQCIVRPSTCHNLFRPPAELKHLFSKFNGGRTTLSVFKVTHIVRSKPVSLQPCIQKNRVFSTVAQKSEEIRRQTFHNLHVEVLDKNHLAAAGFYYTNFKNVVCSAFCKIELKEWKQEDNPFIEAERWSPASPFLKGLFVGNIPVCSNNEQSARSRDVCGSWNCKYHCLYLFFCMCVSFIFLHTNFQCVLYS